MLFLLGISLFSLALDQSLPSQELTFYPSYRFVGCYFGEKPKFGGFIYKCYMLYSGEIVIDYNYLPGKLVNSTLNAPITLYDPFPDTGISEKVLEYRTSTIISGSIRQQAERFVPELGSKVMSFDVYKESMARIYNLPGYYSINKKIDVDTHYDKLTNTYSISTKHRSALRTSLNPLPSHYYHKKLTDKFGEHICFGTISDNGNFDYDVAVGIIRDPEAIKKAKLPPNLYGTREGEEFVYEFRSERLILGKVTGSAFVPEIGSEIVAYADYLSKKLRPLRIYNLPEKYKH
jgi:hypothetical protein